MSKVAVIGAGFSGLSAACFLAKAGHNVTIYEKNKHIGGRARMFEAEGFKFDMGPSWYWMPDVFEKFFANFNAKPSDYYELVQLDPGFQIIFGKDNVLKVPAGIDDIYTVFENIEKGSAAMLRKFLTGASIKYKLGMEELVYKPCLSWSEFMNLPVFRGIVKLSVFDSVSSYVRKYFKDERLVALMEFPSLFLGAMPDNIPALYSLMNYASLSLGTWYPMGGMVKIVDAMAGVATSLGVTIKTGSEISKIEVSGKACKKITTGSVSYDVDAVIASSDYHHTETVLLGADKRNYKEEYWQGKTFAPSCLIFYIGVNKKVKGLIHHNLFFDASLSKHAEDIYKQPQWPKDPLFYVCCPSKTDATVAPEGMENLFILIPIATGLSDNDEIREQYFQTVIKRMEAICGEQIENHIVYKKSYCVSNFIADYNAYKGNAYGLANTLSQTAVLKPSVKNKKVNNLFYTGQLTVPGPGVPPAIISGQIAAELLSQNI